MAWRWWARGKRWRRARAIARQHIGGGHLPCGHIRAWTGHAMPLGYPRNAAPHLAKQLGLGPHGSCSVVCGGVPLLCSRGVRSQLLLRTSLLAHRPPPPHPSPPTYPTPHHTGAGPQEEAAHHPRRAARRGRRQRLRCRRRLPRRGAGLGQRQPRERRLHLPHRLHLPDQGQPARLHAHPRGVRKGERRRWWWWCGGACVSRQRAGTPPEAAPFMPPCRHPERTYLYLRQSRASPGGAWGMQCNLPPLHHCTDLLLCILPLHACRGELGYHRRTVFFVVNGPSSPPPCPLPCPPCPQVIELLKNRGEKGYAVLAMHELGDAHAHFGNWGGATAAWNDTLDTLLGPYQVLGADGADAGWGGGMWYYSRSCWERWWGLGGGGWGRGGACVRAWPCMGRSGGGGLGSLLLFSCACTCVRAIQTVHVVGGGAWWAPPSYHLLLQDAAGQDSPPSRCPPPWRC